MENLGKLPPQATDLEKAVLGALLLERDALNTVVEILKPDHFYQPKHQMVFRSILDLYGNNNPVDILTVTEQLRKNGNLEDVGGAYAVTELIMNVGSSANIEYHSRIIMQCYFKREIIRICTDSASEAYDETSDVFDVVEKLYAVYEVVENEIGRQIDKVSDVLVSRLKAYEEVVQNGITGIPSCYASLDRITAGWQNTDLIIVAGRPAMGKTAFALGLLRNPAIEFGKSVAIFSLEMSKEQLVDRLISAETEIESEVIRKRSFTDDDWKTLSSKTEAIHKASIFIDDTPALNIVQFRAKAKKLKKDHNIQLIIIDYLQLMRGEREKGMSSNREQEISGISRSLKAVAKELKIPVIALSQLSRAVENRPGGERRPKLSDLRESGSIEQDADVVLFLFRPEYYGITEDSSGRSTAGIAEVIVAKHRNGPTDTAVIRFVPRYTKFTDLEQGLGISNQFPVHERPQGFTILPSKSFTEAEDDMPF